MFISCIFLLGAMRACGTLFKHKSIAPIATTTARMERIIATIAPADNPLLDFFFFYLLEIGLYS